MVNVHIATLYVHHNPWLISFPSMHHRFMRWWVPFYFVSVTTIMDLQLNQRMA